MNKQGSVDSDSRGVCVHIPPPPTASCFVPNAIEEEAVGEDREARGMLMVEKSPFVNLKEWSVRS